MLQFPAALLDAADHARQLPGGGVGITLDRGEGALVFAVHAPVQIAIGQRRKHLSHFVDGAAQRIEQLVDATGQTLQEAGTFARLQTLVEIACGGGGNDAGYSILKRQFVRTGRPLHGETEAHALCIEHRRH
ncbi:hypothetical protein G6F68_018108 [Rhizopus microsporus]|nr:hypothetical protein G6F68_018108 [Rhizopus microsporus]